MMKKYIPLSFLLLVVTITTVASNITKPISAQYGFIENKGQIIDQNNKPNPQVLYLYNGNGLHVQLRQDGFSYEVMNVVKTPKAVIDIIPTSKFATQADSFDITYQIHRVDINFKGGNKSALLKPYEPANDYINYYTTATPEGGITQVHHFQKIVYENVYPNIDIEFVLNDAANKGKFKYNFIVKPHANLADIQLEFIGANRTSLTKEGNILIETAHGNLEENIPLSYVINKDNSHSTVKANFIALSANLFGIKVENYNYNQTLVIDPINWATYYGGNESDFGFGVATDASGNILVTGYTISTNAIATSGAHQFNRNGPFYDVFIAKFNTNGIRQWGTYYGGGSHDFSNAIAVNSTGAVLITGKTQSTSGMATTGAHQTLYGGGSEDAFIARFNANGIRQWVTYYGGSGSDDGRAIAVDINGNIIITGITQSANAIASAGTHQTAYSNANDDAFIAVFNTNGVRQWATYYGGNGIDQGLGITTDVNRNIIITGSTTSTNAISTIGSHQSILGSNLASDAFVAKFSANGVRQWATYYGGNEEDVGDAVTTDNNKNIIITGYALSANGIATVGSYQPNMTNPDYEVFITKLDSNGLRQWATYYGGTGREFGNAIVVDILGNIFIAGTTTSNNGIATAGVHQTNRVASYEAFVAKFSEIGAIQWATYYGDFREDFGNGLALDGTGNVIIIGYTGSTTGISTVGAHQQIFGGSVNGWDAFVAKFTSNGMLPVKLISFNAVFANDKVNCTWETASEVNNDYFTIERSVDGEDFEDVGTIKGRGNSSANSRYHFTDNNPLRGISYYRLKQTDYDGKYTYSGIQKVGSTEQLDGEIALHYVNDNPIINIHAAAESIATLELIGLNGITLYTQKQSVQPGENSFAINGNLNTGLYVLKVQLENKVAVFKVWIK